MNIQILKRTYECCKKIIKDDIKFNSESIKIEESFITEKKRIYDNTTLFIVIEPIGNMNAEIETIESRIIKFKSGIRNELYINDVNISVLNNDELFQLSLTNPLYSERNYLYDLNKFLDSFGGFKITTNLKLLTEERLSVLENEIEKIQEKQ